MTRIATCLVLLAIPLIVPCFAQEEQKDKPQEEQQVPTISQVTQQPRTVDGLARVWITIFQACLQAGVPPHQVQVIHPCMLDGLPDRFQAALMRLKVEYRAETILLEVTQEQMIAMCGPFARLAGRPMAVDDQNGQFLMVFMTPGAWRGSSQVFQPRDTTPSGPWPVWVVLKTNYGGTVVPPSLYELLQKYPPPR